MGYFIFESIRLYDGQEWIVAKAIITRDSDIYLKAIDQAKTKSVHTMNANQAGKYRSPELKFNKQLMGTLAEIVAQEYLKEGLKKYGVEKKWEIIRYDDVRIDDFKSPENEYDIKAFRLILENKEYFIESRSSIVKDRTLAEAINSYHIIGSYNSIAKKSEKPNDFYLLPLHLVTARANSYFPTKYQEYFENGDLQVYIVSGCSYSYLQKYGIIDNLKQDLSRFKMIKASKATDAFNFQKSFANFLKEDEE